MCRRWDDGYTLFITTNTTQAANPHLFKKLPYDPIKDFAPVGQLVQGTMLMVVNPALKAQSVAEFIALAKKDPGKLSFGVSSPKRSPLVPGVLTIAESGLPGYSANHWNALYAPAKTPVPVVRRLNDLMRKAMTTDALRQFAEQNGMETHPTAPEELGAFQLAELERWGKIIKEAGIDPE